VGLCRPDSDSLSFQSVAISLKIQSFYCQKNKISSQVFYLLLESLYKLYTWISKFFFLFNNTFLFYNARVLIQFLFQVPLIYPSFHTSKVTFPKTSLLEIHLSVALSFCSLKLFTLFFNKRVSDISNRKGWLKKYCQRTILSNFSWVKELENCTFSIIKIARLENWSGLQQTITFSIAFLK